MKVVGFTFIKDAIIYDYPIVEAIQSILPICDSFIVAVGKSNDETLALIQAIDSSKIKIVETIWDETQREGGRVLALETDKAYHAIDEDADWAFYIQGDEIVHEKYHEEILKAMKQHQSNLNVDGLLFNYLHFYGSYDYIATASNFYFKEVRIIRKNKSFFSYLDAQGFRKQPNQKLNVIQINATMNHYGWVKPPKAMQAKQLNFNKYWHDDSWIETHVAKVDEFDFSNISSLAKFEGTHPEVIKPRIQKLNWTFDFDLSKSKFSLKDKFKKIMFLLFKWNLNYTNYKLNK